MAGPVNPPKVKRLAELAAAIKSGAPTDPIWSPAQVSTLTASIPLYPSPYAHGKAPARAAWRAALSAEIAHLVKLTPDWTSYAAGGFLARLLNPLPNVAQHDSWDRARGIPAYTVECTHPPHSLSHAIPAYAAAAVVQASRDTQASIPPAPQPINWRTLCDAEEITPLWPFVLALELDTLATGTAADRLKLAWFGAMLDMVEEIAMSIVQRLKFRLRVERPSELIVFAPVITPPPHSSFPGGHATIAHAVAAVLHLFFDDAGAGLDPLAAAIANRREELGLHTRIDTIEGRRLGQAIVAFLGGLTAERTKPMSLLPALVAHVSQDWE